MEAISILANCIISLSFFWFLTSLCVSEVIVQRVPELKNPFLRVGLASVSIGYLLYPLLLVFNDHMLYCYINEVKLIKELGLATVMTWVVLFHQIKVKIK